MPYLDYLKCWAYTLLKKGTSECAIVDILEGNGFRATHPGIAMLLHTIDNTGSFNRLLVCCRPLHIMPRINKIIKVQMTMDDGTTVRLNSVNYHVRRGISFHRPPIYRAADHSVGLQGKCILSNDQAAEQSKMLGIDIGVLAQSRHVFRDETFNTNALPA